MEDEPELTPSGALVKLGNATKAAANSDARALMEDEPELTPGGALTKLGMAPLVASQRMAKDALEHTWSAEQLRSLDQAAASAAAVASAALWQPSAAAVPPQPSMAVPPPAPTAASQESPTPPPKPHGWTDADWRHFSAVATDGGDTTSGALRNRLGHLWCQRLGLTPSRISSAASKFPKVKGGSDSKNAVESRRRRANAKAKAKAEA